MSGRDPYAKLIASVVGRVREEVGWMREEPLGDSPIEHLFYVALEMVVRFGGTEFSDLLVPLDEPHAERLMSRERHGLILQPQKQIDDWRVDFLVRAYRWPSARSRVEGWRSLIVECDGHDFHERTKEQAAKDRARDRAVQAAGYTIFRFTGSELWRDPWACAMQVIDWAREGLA